ncbi:hypothetical protein B0T17DRAFT_272026 [Bombardia bombarda]|uniref:Uncharacterized protein n=1 Tax=Bombardia bombarda TaxID=252184 RepID=A0AA39X224_9PEZI|nr:hypothetical protein B0T17DRAFT_272026 [Bombardia bombarda]
MDCGLFPFPRLRLSTTAFLSVSSLCPVSPTVETKDDSYMYAWFRARCGGGTRRNPTACHAVCCVREADHGAWGWAGLGWECDIGGLCLGVTGQCERKDLLAAAHRLRAGGCRLSPPTWKANRRKKIVQSLIAEFDAQFSPGRRLPVPQFQFPSGGQGNSRNGRNPEGPYSERGHTDSRQLPTYGCRF